MLPECLRVHTRIRVVENIAVAARLELTKAVGRMARGTDSRREAGPDRSDVEAAFEAALLGIPAVAFSHHVTWDIYNQWSKEGRLTGPEAEAVVENAAAALGRMIPPLLAQGLPEGASILNINFPRGVNQDTPIRSTRLQNNRYGSLFEPEGEGYRHRYRGDAWRESGTDNQSSAPPRAHARMDAGGSASPSMTKLASGCRRRSLRSSSVTPSVAAQSRSRQGSSAGENVSTPTGAQSHARSVSLISAGTREDRITGSELTIAPGMTRFGSSHAQLGDFLPRPPPRGLGFNLKASPRSVGLPMSKMSRYAESKPHAAQRNCSSPPSTPPAARTRASAEL